MEPPRVTMMDSTDAAIGRLMKNFENTITPQSTIHREERRANIK
jgi:hypothetical protein